MLYLLIIAAVVFTVVLALVRHWHYSLQIVTLAGVLGAWLLFDGQLEQSVVATVGGAVLSVSYIMMLLEMGRKHSSR